MKNIGTPTIIKTPDTFLLKTLVKAGTIKIMAASNIDRACL